MTGRPPARGGNRPRARRRPLANHAPRLRLSVFVIAVALTALGLRLLWLQGVSSTAYASQAQGQRLTTIDTAPTRGAILDRNGNVLAQDVDARSIYVDPGLIKPANVEKEAALLAPLVGVSQDVIRDKMTRSGRFVYIVRGLTPAQGNAVKDKQLPGVGVLTESRRVYPGGGLASNVVGFTDIDEKGIAGIERSLNAILKGTAGKQTVEVDPDGNAIPGGVDKVLEAKPGLNVTLTLNEDIQFEAQKAIAAQVARLGAQSGSVIVLDPRTGQVLANATAPGYDPSNLATVNPANTGNPSVSDIYEPGSVNKVIVAAAALESGVLAPDSVISIPPSLKVADATFKDAEAHGPEDLTFTGVLAKSSNIGAIKIAQLLGNATVAKYLSLFGFGQKSGIEVPGEAAGVLPDVNTWRPTTAATIPFGQGMDVTAIQIAAAYGAVANGGVYVAPRLVLSTTGADGKPVPQPAAPSHRVVSAQTAATLRTMLEQVTSDNGTAPMARIPGYRIAGKTGTAYAVGANGKYNGKYVSSFVGMAPADNPQLVVEVVINQTGTYGGTAAGPVFKDVMSFALKTLGIAPSSTPAPVLPLAP